MRRSTKRNQSGATIIEFTLSLSFLIPLLIGTFVFGFRLVQAQQIDQITRDLAHIYSRGNVDFTGVTNSTGPNEANELAGQFGLTSTGQSCVIFSTITLETAAMCNLGTGTSSNTCTNLGQPVITQQIAIGNATSNQSAFGTPSSTGSLPATSGVSNNYNYSPTNAQLAENTYTVANGFSSILTLTSGQFAYVVEMYDNTPGLSVGGITGKPQVYARAVF
jgi:Flp pilus assembly protein TadG